LIVVPDAGPLIYLAGARHLGLLPALYTEVVVSRSVFDEVVVRGAGLPGATEVSEARWLRVEDAPPDPLLLRFLDHGEASAIPLAERLHAALLADDADARRIAAARGLVVVGTLGVLLAAKNRGLIPAVAPIVRQMESLGMYVSDSLRNRVLQLAGEG